MFETGSGELRGSAVSTPDGVGQDGTSRTAVVVSALERLASPAAADVVRPVVQRALDLPVGPALAAAADALTGTVDVLSAAELRQVVVARRRLGAHAAAGELTVVAALDDALAVALDDGAHRSGRAATMRKRAAGDVSVALGVAPRTAGRLVALSRQADGFPLRSTRWPRGGCPGRCSRCSSRRLAV